MLIFFFRSSSGGKLFLTLFNLWSLLVYYSLILIYNFTNKFIYIYIIIKFQTILYRILLHIVMTSLLLESIMKIFRPPPKILFKIQLSKFVKKFTWEPCHFMIKSQNLFKGKRYHTYFCGSCVFMHIHAYFCGSKMTLYLVRKYLKCLNLYAALRLHFMKTHVHLILCTNVKINNYVNMTMSRPTFRRCRMSYLPVLLYIR